MTGMLKLTKPNLARAVPCAVLAIALCGVSQAQWAPERLALNSLLKGKYHRASRQINRMLSRDTASASAHYLLVRYYFWPDNPAFNIDSAHFHCQTGAALLKQTSGKARERLSRLSIDSASFIFWQAKIDSAAFARAKHTNTEEAYQYFLDRFPNAAQRLQAVELRDEVAFLSALRENTWHKYPRSHRTADALARYEKLLYQAKTNDHKLESYRNFITEFPQSPYRPEAEWHILQISTAWCTVQSLMDFIQTYPKSIHRNMALGMLYHLLKEKGESMPDNLLTDSLRKVVYLEKLHLIPFFKNASFGWMNTAGQECIAPRPLLIPEELRCGFMEDDVWMADGVMLSRNGVVLAQSVQEIDDLGYGFLLVTADNCRYVLHK